MITTDAERQSLLHQFSASEDLLLRQLEGASEAQLDFKPSPECWSMRQIAEHVALVEEMLFGHLLTAAPSSETSDRRMDEKIHRGAPNRIRPVPAPQAVHPTGRFPTPADATAHLHAMRNKAIGYSADPSRDLRALRILHPVAGPLDLFQYLLIMAYHPQRHANQIAEIKSNPAFPRTS